MSNVLIYTRVSTDEQADKGFSLRHQKQMLELYCGQKGHHILRHFQEDFSAKNFDRPEFKKLMAFVKSNRKRVDHLLFTRWDRFSRNQEEAYRVIRQFRNMGIEVNAVEQPLDLSQADSKVMLAVYLVIPEVENDKIGLRTKFGLRRAQREGCFTGIAPFGYSNTRNEEGKSTLAIKEDVAPLIQKAFGDYASGNYSTEEIRKKHFSKYKMSKQSLLNVLKNPTYIGKIHIRAWKKEEEELVKGLHPAIIDERTFYIVQQRFRGKKVDPIHKHSEIDEHLPLRGHLLCRQCGRALTGSASKGRTGKRHFYYHCQPKCKERFKAEDANRLFEEMLAELSIKEDVKQLYQRILKQAYHGGKSGRDQKCTILQKQLKKLQERLLSIETKFFDDLIDVSTYKSMKSKTEEEIADVTFELDQLNQLDREFDEYLKEGISLLHGIDRVYKTSPSHLKKKIVGKVFPRMLVYMKSRFVVKEMNTVLFTLIEGRGLLPQLLSICE